MVILAAAPAGYLFNDSHLHLTNYVQKGPDVRELLQVMGDKAGRATLFGIPLQQRWDYRNSGEYAPTYYLQSDAPLYYYSFTDAQIAMAYRSLTPEQQARFDPMITGFDPGDMYAVDHIRRVMLTFPGVFVGLGEFTIHKEFVSSKIAGGPASLTNPALDRIFELAAEIGIPAILHSDVSVPFPKAGQEPYMVAQLRDLVLRHPNTTVIWAHCGLGRLIHPVADEAAMLERAISALPKLHFDLSWSETAKYLTANEGTLTVAAELLNRHPDRFLFGTDEVGPTRQSDYLKVYEQYAPLLQRLSPKARAAVLKGNYERIFDEARRNARAWERLNAGKTQASR